MSGGCVSFGAQLLKENRSSVENMITQFLDCFRADDDCILFIICDNQGFWGLKELFLSEGFKKNYAWESPDVSWLTTAEFEKTKTKIDYMLKDEALKKCHWIDLYTFYQKADRNAAKDTYENEEVTHEYDLNEIKRVRKEGEENYIGSTNLNKMHDYLDYLRWLSAGGKSRPTILEAGCGAGATFHLMDAYCKKNGLKTPDYQGFDYGRSQVKRAIQNYPENRFFIGDCQNITFVDSSSVDCAIAHSVLQFVPDPIKALKEIIRVSKGDSFLSISCTTFENRYVQGPVEFEFPWRFLNRRISTFLYFADFSIVMKTIKANGLRFKLADEQLDDDLKYYSIQVYPKAWYDERYEKVDRSVDNYALIDL